MPRGDLHACTCEVQQSFWRQNGVSTITFCHDPESIMLIAQVLTWLPPMSPFGICDETAKPVLLRQDPYCN